jgi:hypothetical protein
MSGPGLPGDVAHRPGQPHQHLDLFLGRRALKSGLAEPDMLKELTESPPRRAVGDFGGLTNCPWTRPWIAKAPVEAYPRGALPNSALKSLISFTYMFLIRWTS